MTAMISKINWRKKNPMDVPGLLIMRLKFSEHLAFFETDLKLQATAWVEGRPRSPAKWWSHTWCKADEVTTFQQRATWCHHMETLQHTGAMKPKQLHKFALFFNFKYCVITNYIFTYVYYIYIYVCISRVLLGMHIKQQACSVFFLALPSLCLRRYALSSAMR